MTITDVFRLLSQGKISADDAARKLGEIRRAKQTWVERLFF